MHKVEMQIPNGIYECKLVCFKGIRTWKWQNDNNKCCRGELYYIECHVPASNSYLKNPFLWYMHFQSTGAQRKNQNDLKCQSVKIHDSMLCAKHRWNSNSVLSEKFTSMF